MSRIKILIPDDGPKDWELSQFQKRLIDKRAKKVKFIYTLKQKTKCQ
jgi:hypothetical protein